MTEYGYVDPRSIYSERTQRNIRTRKPEEILQYIKKWSEEA